MFNHILVPTDGSHAALGAAEQIAAVAASMPGARVTIVVVIAPRSPIATDLSAEFVAHQNAAMKDAACRALEATADVFERCKVSFDVKVIEGDPVSAALATEAESGDYDTIAISTRGFSLQNDAVRYVGSVTEHLLRRVSLPVLVIPACE